jgi:uncharacterized membrane protein
MSAGSKARRTGDSRAAVRAVQRRGLQIFLLAFVFRFQSFVLSHSPAWALLKVDILNIMGPAIVLAATVWGLCRTARARVAAFVVLTVAIVWLTPALRNAGGLAILSDSLEGYLRPIPNLTNFTLFPWMAFLTAGAATGVLLDAARTPEADRRLNAWLGVSGLAMSAIAYQASFLPALWSRSSFWTTSASFFFLRLGLMISAIGAAYLWEQRPTAGRRWSPLRLLGRSSLFIYWIHVELVYGLISLPLHGAFSLAGAWIGLGLFCLLMLAAAVGKDRATNWWRGEPLNPYKAGAYFRSSAGGVKP